MAVLRLRASTATRDLDPYWRRHTRREHERVHPVPDRQDYTLTA
ncbi:hypothetical protein [Yinghuangia soli]|nr:hypothetical protein [Yinghuangia soli]